MDLIHLEIGQQWLMLVVSFQVGQQSIILIQVQLRYNHVVNRIDVYVKRPHVRDAQKGIIPMEVKMPFADHVSRGSSAKMRQVEAHVLQENIIV